MNLYFNHDVYTYLFVDPSGPLGQLIYTVTDTVVKPDVQDTLSVPYVEGTLNPPPGPPMMRTGVLRESVTTTHPQVTPAGPMCEVVVEAINPDTGELYSLTLFSQGYRFASPRYYGLSSSSSGASDIPLSTDADIPF